MDVGICVEWHACKSRMWDTALDGICILWYMSGSGSSACQAPSWRSSMRLKTEKELQKVAWGPDMCRWTVQPTLQSHVHHRPAPLRWGIQRALCCSGSQGIPHSLCQGDGHHISIGIAVVLVIGTKQQAVTPDTSASVVATHWQQQHRRRCQQVAKSTAPMAVRGVRTLSAAQPS